MATEKCGAIGRKTQTTLKPRGLADPKMAHSPELAAHKTGALEKTRATRVSAGFLHVTGSRVTGLHRDLEVGAALMCCMIVSATGKLTERYANISGSKCSYKVPEGQDFFGYVCNKTVAQLNTYTQPAAGRLISAQQQQQQQQLEREKLRRHAVIFALR